MFIGPHRKWLNKMAQKGYRLVRTGKLEYEFEECAPGQYTYEIEYVGDQSFKSEQDYKEFLESLGYKVFYKNMNLDYSTGKVTLRPFAEKGGRISTKKDTYDKELLIIEKENDGKPFELHSTPSDKISYYKRLRNPWLIMSAIFLILASFFLFPLLWIFGGLCLLPALRCQLAIRKERKESAGTDAGGPIGESAAFKVFAILSLVLIVAGLTVRLSLGDRISFASVNRKSGSFIGYYESQVKGLSTARMAKANGKITRTVTPKNGSKEFHATLETSSGSIKLTVKNLDGTVLYEIPEGSANTSFTLNTNGEKLVVYMELDSFAGNYRFEYK